MQRLYFVLGDVDETKVLAQKIVIIHSSCYWQNLKFPWRITQNQSYSPKTPRKKQHM